MRPRNTNLIKLLIAFILILVLSSCSNTSPLPPTVKPQNTPTEVPLQMPSGNGGGVIVFSSDRDGGLMDLYLINADGSELIQLTHTRDDELAPAWSADGSMLAYLVSKNNQLNLYVLDVSVGLSNPGQDQSLKLTQQAVAESPPAWFPAGDRLLYSVIQEDNQHIFVINADGSGEKQLTDSESSEKYPAISPDGTKLVFSSNRLGSFDLFLIENFNPNTLIDQEAVLLTSSPGDELFPAWSPDGKRIIYTSTENGNKDIVVTNWDGSNSSSLNDSPADEWKASWSPDNEQYVFSYFNFNSTLNDLFIGNLNASALTQITSDSFDNWWPAWKP